MLTKLQIFTNYKEIPRVNANYTCLAVISLDSALKKDENIICKYFLKCVNTLRKN